MIRVLSIIHHPSWGGPHNRNSRVAPLLETRGVHTTVMLPDEPGDGTERLRACGVETVQIPLQRIRGSLRPSVHARHIAKLPSDVRAIRKVMRERNIGLVQINGLGNPQGAIAAKLEGAAVVWQILDVGYPMVIRGLAMALVARLADVLMTTGIRVAREHPGALSFGQRLITFFPPVDTRLFKPDAGMRTAARRKLGIAPDDLVIGTVGNINAQKDHITFIRGASVLRRRFPGTRFVILGGTLPNRIRLADRLQQEAAALGLCVGQDLIVKNPGAQVFELAQAFDIFWLTSRWEGIPTAVEEAMALGLPVVSMDVGGVSEAVQDGVTGVLVAPRDTEMLVRSTISLIQTPALRISMAEKARSSALQRFDVSICADVHARAFEMAIARNAARTVSASQ